MQRIRRAWRVLAEELGGQTAQLWLLNLLPRLLPIGAAGRLRSALYRAFGMPIGDGTLIVGPLTLGVGSAPARVCIGKRCFINRLVYVDAAAMVRIGDGVSLGHHVTIITSDHTIGSPEFRAGPLAPRSVTIGNGCWIAAGAFLLPGISVGAGAIVAAGSIVTRDVPPNTLVGGVPARIIRRLEEESTAPDNADLTA